ncbi:retron Ec67 family RNA-directed DNA polymerase/endonuclease [Enterovirga aerilata]|nr:retron Ec67 family RNA-directed DNA polymerase/endonuclease [Enterovirga sp. DB1703]
MSVESLLLLRLRACTDLSSVARVLGLTPAVLSFVLYKIPTQARYRTFSIAKRAGGSRAIMAPNERLKMVQRRLASVLLQIQTEQERSRTKKACILSHGFKRELSILTNARNHRNKRFVFNLDLEDFFPTFNFGRVRGFFMRDQNFQLHPAAATVLAQIACHNNHLPQGSPCSPVISNLLAHMLDLRLNKIARRHKCTYTRYADDLTFSTNKKDFPEVIGATSPGDPNKWSAGNDLLASVYLSGHKINHSKTRMQYRDSRQETTGLVVNRKINVSVDYYKLVRAMCDRLFASGIAFRQDKNKIEPVSRSHLQGKLAFIYHIRGQETSHRKLQKKDQPGYYRLYSQFLDYCNLYDVDRPTIICEGKTDNVYIRSAIEALSSKVPGLLDSEKKLTVRLFKYTKITSTIQDLAGGTDQLKKLVREYANRTQMFKTTPSHPLILVTDVDKGSTEFFKAVSAILGTTVAGADPFYHLIKNLYVVPVPKIKHPETAIEDLFDDTLLNEKVDGKSFDRTNKEKDGTKFYGKHVFATRVVWPNRSTINFARFEPLLRAFEDVKSHYKTLTSTSVKSPAPIAAAA